MSYTPQSRRRTIDVDTSGSPASDSLAEWSQKIKSLQQQVDEDGLQEQARLEAEIAKSRMDRARRRSTLTGNARIDQASVTYLSKLDDTQNQSSNDREQNVTDSLNRLTGSGNDAQAIQPPQKSKIDQVGSSTAAPMSLAEFMGGRASGPRLNKHAPQSDSQEHLRDYRDRINGNSKPLLQRLVAQPPVALHGLASSVTPSKGSVTSKPPSTPPTSMSNEKKLDQPSQYGGNVEKAQRSDPEIGPKPTVSQTSSINSLTPQSSQASSLIHKSEDPLQRSTSQPKAILITPKKIETSPEVSTSPATSPRNGNSTPVAARWLAATSGSPLKSPPLSASSSSKSQTQPQTLARAIAPSTAAPQQFVPPSNPSPAFLKPTTPKEERPSITRLKGRGFVERQVKVSAQLYTPPEEVPKSTPPEKKLAVLDRWPGINNGTKSSTEAPKKIDIPRREFTSSAPPDTQFNRANVFQANQTKRPRDAENDRTPLKLPGMQGTQTLTGGFARTPQTSAGAKQQGERPDSGAPPVRLPGLAAGPNTPSALKKSNSGSNLRGSMRRRSVHFESDDDDNEGNGDSHTSILDGNQTDATNTKKLTHLTKDRVRKPRKAATTAGTVTVSASNLVEPTNRTPTKLPFSTTVAVDTLSQGKEKPVGTKQGLPAKQDPFQTAQSTNSDEKPKEVRIPAAASQPSPGARPKLPPPAIAPKPVALRRSSLPSPAEQTFPSPLNRSTPNLSKSAEPSSPTMDAFQKGSGSTPSLKVANDDQEEEVARPSVKSMVSSWGQQPQTPKYGDKFKDALSRTDGSIGESQEASRGDGVAEDAQFNDSPAIVVPSVLNPPAIPMPQPRPRPITPGSERRRSSISNRYSSIVLPPLKEVPTPESSLREQTANTNIPTARDLQQSMTYAYAGAGKESGVDEMLAVKEKSTIPTINDDVSIQYNDEPVPSFNLSSLLASVPSPLKVIPGSTISVDAHLISGSSATIINENRHVLYDAEIIAVVHRGKPRTGGLVTTSVWGWIGCQANLTEKESTKLQELASRFNTSLVQIKQGKEPYDLVQVLGGTIAIRRGSRTHWSSENTALHCVRTHGSHFIVIEEVELMSRNISSAFTYCLAILDALIIWHGRGSTKAERDAAAEYAKLIATEGVDPVDMEEGVEDDMFWAMLDEDEYASADFWRFRSQSQIIAPRLWAVANNAIQPIVPFSAYDLERDKVLMYDGIFELFVIVGEAARGQRQNIRLALAAMEALAAASAMTRSFPPPVHVLIFPTRIPLDLRVNFRLMDHQEMQALQSSPDHINLVTVAEANDQLNQREWKLDEIKDVEFLPLGVSPSLLMTNTTTRDDE